MVFPDTKNFGNFGQRRDNLAIFVYNTPTHGTLDVEFCLLSRVSFSQIVAYPTVLFWNCGWHSPTRNSLHETYHIFFLTPFIFSKS